MKKEMSKKKYYVAPQVEVIDLEVSNVLMAVSGAGVADDISYGGLGGDDEYGD